MDCLSVFRAYCHFEAPSDRTYEFNCVDCGFHPAVLIADLNRKVAFKCCTVDDTLPNVYDKEADLVDCDLFWEKVEKNAISIGFSGRTVNAFKIEPSLIDRDPIGRNSRIPNKIFNTENRKVNRDTGEPECECRELSEERLISRMLEGKLVDVQRIARKLMSAQKVQN